MLQTDKKNKQKKEQKEINAKQQAIRGQCALSCNDWLSCQRRSYTIYRRMHQFLISTQKSHLNHFREAKQVSIKSVTHDSPQTKRNHSDNVHICEPEHKTVAISLLTIKCIHSLCHYCSPCFDCFVCTFGILEWPIALAGPPHVCVVCH